MTYQPALTRLLGLILAAVLGLVLALAVVSASRSGGSAGPGVLATGSTVGGSSPPPHPNVELTGSRRTSL
jgi:hypothetical protein